MGRVTSGSSDRIAGGRCVGVVLPSRALDDVRRPSNLARKDDTGLIDASSGAF